MKKSSKRGSKKKITKINREINELDKIREIADMCDNIKPFSDELRPPKIDDAIAIARKCNIIEEPFTNRNDVISADEYLREFVYYNAHRIYGKDLDPFIEKRIETDSKEAAWWPQLHSFAVGLEGSPDLIAAQKAADYIGTVHHEVHFTIQEALDALRDGQKAAIRSVWENKATIASVARQSHVARQTFYNNPLLTEYVNAWLKEYAVENPFDTIERLREALRDETEKVRKMVARDADVSKYKAMVVDLKDEVAALKKTVATQSDTIAMMRRTNFAVSDGKKK